MRVLQGGGVPSRRLLLVEGITPRVGNRVLVRLAESLEFHKVSRVAGPTEDQRFLLSTGVWVCRSAIRSVLLPVPTPPANLVRMPDAPR
jgi:hypothetical protein